MHAPALLPNVPIEALAGAFDQRAATTDLPLPAQAMLTVLRALLPPDTPCELTTEAIARAGGFAPRHVTPNLILLEQAGYIRRVLSAPGRAGTITRHATPLAPTPAPPALPRPRVTPVMRHRAQAPASGSVAGALRDYFRAYPPGTELTTATRELAQAVGASPGQVSLVLGQLIQAGQIERLPGKQLRLRIGASIAAPIEPTHTTRELVEQHLSVHPPGAEVFVSARQIAKVIGRGMAGVVRAMQELEAEGAIRRIIRGRGTLVTILAPLGVSPALPVPPAPLVPELPAPPTPTSLTPAPTRPASTPKRRGPKARTLPQRNPHAALWQHLLASQSGLIPVDWLLSGLTLTVQPDATVLTCQDAARAETARTLHDTLTAALRALELPDTLVIQQAPADNAPPPTPGAVSAYMLLDDPVSALRSALRSLPTITEAEARTLLAQVQAGQAAHERQQTLTHSGADLAAALAQAVAAGRAAWEQLILSHLRQVVGVALRYPSERLPLEERIQAGTLELMHTVARSDGKLVIPFVFFTYRAARRGIWAAIRAEHPIRRPSNSTQVFQAQTRLRERLGRAPTAEEIAQEAGMRVSTVLAVLAAWMEAASLDAPLQPDAERTLGDVLPDDLGRTPEALVLAREEQQTEREALRAALDRLAPHERRVIALRYGLKGPEQSVTEVAFALGWTVRRVRRIEEGALAALRAKMGVQEVD
jgi:RNA polymerase primary sigma factor